MAGRLPEDRVRFSTLRQRWEQVAFLHWRYPADELQRLVPVGLVVEEIDGSAWVGVVAFLARATRLAGVVPTPGGSDFPETNLRTYVRLPSGLDAVWFLRLDVANAFLATTGRALVGLPYHRARMSVREHPGKVEYVTEGAATSHRLVVRPLRRDAAEAVSERDEVLAGRWRAVVPRAPRDLTVSVQHEPWTLQPAEVVEFDGNLLASAGLHPPSAPPIACWAAGVRAAVGWPRVRRGGPRPAA